MIDSFGLLTTEGAEIAEQNEYNGTVMNADKRG